MTAVIPVHPIVAQVCALWGVSAAMVMAGGGNDDCERARQDAMALLRAVHDVSYRALGRRFGIGHAEAKVAVRTAAARIQHDPRHGAKLLQVLLAKADTQAFDVRGVAR